MTEGHQDIGPCFIFMLRGRGLKGNGGFGVTCLAQQETRQRRHQRMAFERRRASPAGCLRLLPVTGTKQDKWFVPRLYV